jgi:uncharacterized protein (TIGR00369 family)
MSRSTTVTWQDPRILSDLRAICDGRLPQPPMAELLGFRLAQVDKGQVVFECEPGERHYNPIGVVHGGLAMTMLDSCMACSIQTMVPPGSSYTTLEAKVNLVRAITNGVGKLRAIGRTIHVGSRVGTSEGRLEDASGKLYAHGTTTCIVLRNDK